ncbi:MAG: iron ABC transporter substrate-binding protein [Gemmatimonadales bacterium]
MSLRTRLLLPLAALAIIATAIITFRPQPVVADNTVAAAPLVIYAGRSRTLVEPLVERFKRETGLEVEVRYGNTPQLALAIQQEGRRTPADVFWAQDTGPLQMLSETGAFAELPADLYSRIPDVFKTADRTWVATSGRARTLVYSPTRVSAAELPKSVYDLTNPKWKGRIGWAPTNASFQAFITAMRAEHGEARARQWLTGMIANEPKAYPRNTPIVQAVAAGEVDLGLPNHYYLIGLKKENPALAAEQTFFADGDIGNLVFVAGAAVLNTSPRQAEALRFLRFLLTAESQQYFTNDVSEYPVTTDVPAAPGLVAPEALSRAAPRVPMRSMNDLEGTLKLLRELGLL